MADEKTARNAPLGPRVDTLEAQVAELRKTTAQLRRDQSTTRRLVRDLGKRVDQILPTVKTHLDAQTEAINEHVDEQLEEQRQFVLATIVDVARQWPAPALVAVTFMLAIAAAVLAAWVLTATNHLHVG